MLALIECTCGEGYYSARRLAVSRICHRAVLRRGELGRLLLLLEHGLPDPLPGVDEPVLELLLVHARLLHEHDLFRLRGVRVGEVLGTQEPRRERRDGAHGELRPFCRFHQVCFRLIG